jgi:serine kinase of HPr protein (carbohydrate metabolism regulator)
MRQPLQATAVDVSGRAVLIEGRAGYGKSSLALALIDRGARLIGDDSVHAGSAPGRLPLSSRRIPTRAVCWKCAISG